MVDSLKISKAAQKDLDVRTIPREVYKSCSRMAIYGAGGKAFHYRALDSPEYAGPAEVGPKRVAIPTAKAGMNP